MDAGGFTFFTDLLKQLAGGLGAAQPQAGQGAPNSPGGGLAAWQIPDTELADAPDYDIGMARQMVNRYIEAGFDPRYAVGMAANAVQESGLDPNAYNKGEKAIGLFQYRDQRAKNLRAFADAQGQKYNDAMTQVDFSIYEKFNGERGVVNKIYNRNPETAADFAALQDQYYERSAGTERGRRRQLASDMWRRLYGDKQYTGGPTYPTQDKVAEFLGQPRQTEVAQANPFRQLFETIGTGAMDAYEQATQPEAQMVAYSPTAQEGGGAQDAIANFLSVGQQDRAQMQVADLQAQEEAKKQPPVETTPPDGGQGGTLLEAFTKSPIGAFLGGPAAYAGAMGEALTSKTVPPENRDPNAEVKDDELTLYEQAEKDLGISPPNTKLDLPDVPQPRRTYGEADSMRNEFKRLWVRDEGESDQDVRARRRGMFIQAADVLQAIGTGGKFDPAGGARVNIAERNQNYQQDLQYAQEKRAQEALKATVDQQGFQNKMGMVQENRMQDRLTLDKAMFDFTKTTKLAELGKDKAVQGAMVDWAKNNGYEQFVPLIQAGATGVAGDLIKADLKKKTEETKAKQGASAFTLNPDNYDAIRERAARVGKEDLADIAFNWETAPRAAEEAYKEIMTAEDDTVDIADRAAALKGMIPAYLSKEEKERLGVMADQAARDKTAYDELAKAVQAAIDASPKKKLMSELMTTAGKNYELQTQGSAGLEEAAYNALEFATNPAFKGSPLGGNVLVPIAKYVNSLPGMGDTFKDLTGINDVTIFGNKLLEAKNRGQLGNLAQGVTGQLSNLEGQMLLSILGDGRVTNVEIMALSQAILKRTERANTARDAAFEYEQQVYKGQIENPSATDMKKYIDQRVQDEHGDMFKRLDNKEAYAEYLDAKISQAAMAAGMSTEKYMQQDQGEISRRLLGEVVMVYDEKQGGYRLQPLFNSVDQYQMPVPEAIEDEEKK